MPVLVQCLLSITQLLLLAAWERHAVITCSLSWNPSKLPFAILRPSQVKNCKYLIGGLQGSQCVRRWELGHLSDFCVRLLSQSERQFESHTNLLLQNQHNPSISVGWLGNFHSQQEPRKKTCFLIFIHKRSKRVKAPRRRHGASVWSQLGSKCTQFAPCLLWKHILLLLGSNVGI